MNKIFCQLPYTNYGIFIMWTTNNSGVPFDHFSLSNGRPVTLFCTTFQEGERYLKLGFPLFYLQNTGC